MHHAMVGARALRRLVFVLSALVATFVALVPASMAEAKTDRTERSVVRYINNYRASHGLAGVRISRRMNGGADGHSLSMARHRYVTHGAWASRVRRSARSNTIGEVIGWLAGRNQARGIVSMWINSAPHRAVLLNGSYRRLGVARRKTGRTYYYTVDFAR